MSFSRQRVEWHPRYTVLLVAMLANFGLMTARLVISPVIPDVAEAFAVSKADIGLALTGMWAAYALVQGPSGVLGEHVGERRVILVALALTGVACLALAAAPSFLVFGLCAVLVGLGASLYFPVATVLITRRFENRGQALGVHTMGAPLAGLVTPVAAAYLAVTYGWRWAIGLGAVVAIPASLLFAWQVGPTPPASAETRLRDRVSPARIAGLFTRPPLLFTAAVSAMCVFTWQSYASFFPTFLIEYRGLGTDVASVAFGATFVISAVCLPLLGRLSDRLDRDAVLGAAFVTTGVGLTLVLTRGSRVAFLAGVVVMGVGLGWGGVLQARYMALLSPEERGTGYGFVRSAYMLVGALGSVVTGTLAEAASWPVAYGLVVAIIVTAGVVVLGNRALNLGL